MEWRGILIGVVSFLVIGLFHPIVIKCEYYFTEKCWPVFLVGGIIACGVSLFIENIVASAIVAIFGFSMLWSIIELKEQTQRVERGWFPANPRRAQKKQAHSEDTAVPEEETV